MKMELVSISISNFKALNNFSHDFNGKDTTIIAENGSGKSTIYDAFLWVLFGKNSDGKSSFEVKPIVDGVVTNFVEPTVELVLRIDGEDITFKKALREKWTQKRGFDTKELTGHETLTWVNEVPKTATEYKNYIASIISEETFKNVTSSEYFMSLDKKAMRQTLVDMVGEVDMFEVAGDDERLVSLCNLLEEKKLSVADMLKVCKDKISTYEKDKVEIPARIDELMRGVIVGVDYSLTETVLNQHKAKLSELDAKISTASNGSSETEAKRAEIDALHEKAKVVASELCQKANDEYEQKSQELWTAKHNLEQLRSGLNSVKSSILDNSNRIDLLSRKLLELKNEHGTETDLLKEANELVFEGIADGETLCKSCGQTLPIESLKSLKKTAEDNFTSLKEKRVKTHSEALQGIVKQGKEYSASKKALVAENDELLLKKLDYEKKIADAEKLVEKLNIYMAKNDRHTSVEFANHKDVLVLMDKADAIRASIIEVKADNSLSEERTLILAEIDRLNSILYSKTETEKTLARIEELKLQVRNVSDLIAVQVGIKRSIEIFTQKRAKMLEDSINGMFEYINFRLSKTNINGGIEDDCEPLVGRNSVPYSSNGSTGEKIRARLDIVKTMQKKFGVFAPVFVDDAESITIPFKVDTQVIKLFAKEGITQLQIKED